MAISISHPTNRPNFTRVESGDNILYFSYETLVGFAVPGIPGTAVIQNYWSTTTGKHLNYIDNGNKEGRLTRAQFDQLAAYAGIGN